VPLLQVSEIWSGEGVPEEFVELDNDQRRRSRQRVVSTFGREVALILPRGTNLKEGERLRADDGTLIGVRATRESLSRMDCDSLLDLARVAYHLGNRHVALQIGTQFVAYQRDSVLDNLVGLLGFRVRHVTEAFEPEPGAYRNHQWESPQVTFVREPLESVP